jgi:chemotaxis regulatin CheY-phosphate phosphatase CheZ
MEAGELSNQVSMLARMVRARLLKGMDAESLEEAHLKIDDAIDGLDTIIEMTAPPPVRDGQGDGSYRCRPAGCRQQLLFVRC